MSPCGVIIKGLFGVINPLITVPVVVSITYRHGRLNFIVAVFPFISVASCFFSPMSMVSMITFSSRFQFCEKIKLPIFIIPFFYPRSITEYCNPFFAANWIMARSGRLSEPQVSVLPVMRQTRAVCPASLIPPFGYGNARNKLTSQYIEEAFFRPQ